MPKKRNGDKTFVNPRVKSSGDVVLINKELAIIRKMIRKAKTAPVLKPSEVILKYATLDKTCFPELKNRGKKKEAKIREVFFLILRSRKLKGILETMATIIRNKESHR